MRGWCWLREAPQISHRSERSSVRREGGPCHPEAGEESEKTWWGLEGKERLPFKMLGSSVQMDSLKEGRAATDKMMGEAQRKCPERSRKSRQISDFWILSVNKQNFYTM